VNYKLRLGIINISKSKELNYLDDYTGQKVKQALCL
jgi:hypothetical protein